MSAEAKKSRPQSAGEAHAVVIGRQYQIYPDRPLPDLASPMTEAFEAVDRKDTGRPMFALVCDPSVAPRLDIMGLIAYLDRMPLLTPEDWGVTDWPPAEAQRYVLVYPQPGGDRLLAGPDATMTPMRQDDVIRIVILSLLPLLEDLSSRVITHRAIRADNLYYRDDTRRSVILGECVSTPPGLCQPVLYETIENGMANPAGRGAGYLADDLYAFGVMLAVLLNGGNPCAGMTDDEIIASKIRFGSYGTLLKQVRASLTMLEPLRGLLCDDPRERWNATNIRMWLEGRKLTPKQAMLPQAPRPFRFANAEHWNVRALSHAMRLNWAEATRIALNDDITEWVRRSLDDDEQAAAIANAKRAAHAGTSGAGNIEDRLVSRVLMALDPRAPLHYRSFSVSIDGLGQKLAIDFHKPDTVQLFVEVVNAKLPQAWVEAQAATRPEYMQLRKSVEMAADFLSRPRPGFGVERCLYEWNEGWPCQSPLFQTDLVCDLEHLLPALERAAKRDQLGDGPVDAHIAAFCATRHSKLPERLFHDLEKTAGPHVQRVAMLGLLAEVQRVTGPAKLPALGGWFARNMSPVIEAYRNRIYRQKLRENIGTVAASGNLTELLTLVSNEDGKPGDEAGYEQAKLHFAQAEHEVEWLAEGGLVEPERVALASQQASTLVSALLSGILLIVLTLMYAT